jgi:hypothetical protein
MLTKIGKHHYWSMSMITPTKLFSSKKNIFAVASLLSTLHLYPMMNNGTIIIKQRHTVTPHAKLYSSKNSPLHKQAATTSNSIENFSTMNTKAHWEYFADKDIRAYTEKCKEIDHQHHFLLNQLRTIENEAHNVWQECQSLTWQQLRSEPEKQQQILDILALCKQESVTTKLSQLLHAKAQRDRVLQQEIKE